MNSVIRVIQNEKFGRLSGYVDEEGVVYLNLGDVAQCLGFIKSDGTVRLKDMRRLLKEAEYTKKFNAKDYVPESVFYFLAMQADSPNAKGFQKWLARDVVPSIRKTGKYSVNRTAAVPALPSPAIRQANIDTRKRFTSTLQIYINYAKRQGDYREPDRIYSKFTTLANQTVGIPKGERPKSELR